MLEESLRRQVLDHALSALGDKAMFDTWIRNLSFLPSGEQQFRVPVANVYLLDEYRRNYTQLLQDAFLAVNGKPAEILFVVDPATAPVPGAPSAEDASAPITSRAPEALSAVVAPVAVPQPPKLGPALNADYDFEQFVVGPCNRLAHAVAMAVAESPAKAYNPLFIHGAVGLGKTHLLQAVCWAIARRHPASRIEYLPCESFVNSYVSAMKKQQLEGFRNYLRNVDVFAVDDIHFLRGKEGSQEEIFHTFNALHMAHKQMLFSSDSRPQDIPTLEERLVSRFNWGMVTRLDAPSFEVRMAIVKMKMEAHQVPITDELAQYVANLYSTNMRDLHSAAAKISARAKLTGHAVDQVLIDEALSDSLPTPAASVNFQDIITAVCRYFHLRPQDIQSPRKVRSVAMPRQVAMYLMKQHSPLSLEEIGAFFGGKDHSTVIHAVNKIKAKMETDRQFKLAIEHISSQLLGK
ncbi:MAG: chromosomal replication initiator protein DnaA [Planctomycetota bacterium]|nr:chromosomal replication initiator protein DnaA [Planctomycetota bacterium]